MLYDRNDELPDDGVGSTSELELNNDLGSDLSDNIGFHDTQGEDIGSAITTDKKVTKQGLGLVDKSRSQSVVRILFGFTADSKG